MDLLIDLTYIPEDVQVGKDCVIVVLQIMLYAFSYAAVQAWVVVKQALLKSYYLFWAFRAFEARLESLRFFMTRSLDFILSYLLQWRRLQYLSWWSLIKWHLVLFYLILQEFVLMFKSF